MFLDFAVRVMLLGGVVLLARRVWIESQKGGNS